MYVDNKFLYNLNVNLIYVVCSIYDHKEVKKKTM